MLYSWSEIQKGDRRYFTDKIGRRTVYLHRLVMGDPPGLTIDHKDNNTLDCRKSNLREATYRQQLGNTRPRPGTATGLKGAYLSPTPGKFTSRIRTAEGRHQHLGTFDTAEEAQAAYAAAALKHHGEFARVQ